MTVMRARNSNETVRGYASAMRTAKIEKIRVAVEAGTYAVDLETLAERIVESDALTIDTPADSASS
jgi:anti-sigma28 factor (negative regulator of flagellin synthesis)